MDNNSSINNLFDSAIPSSKNGFQNSSFKPANDSFAFNDFVASSQASASRPLNSFASGPSFTALPPPPSAPNPVQRSNFSGFGVPQPSGASSNFGFPPPTSMSKSKNDDILDLFKQTPQPKPQNSTNIDELFALVKPPTNNPKPSHSKDPFADLLK